MDLINKISEYLGDNWETLDQIYKGLDLADEMTMDQLRQELSENIGAPKGIHNRLVSKILWGSNTHFPGETHFAVLNKAVKQNV